LAPKKERPRDLKKQRWAGIVAAILALAMLVSVAGIYIGQAMGNDAGIVPEQPQEPQPEDYLDYYRTEVERLEAHIEEHEPSEAVLMELAENYRYLIFIQQAFFNDQEALEEYRKRLASLYRDLIEMDPSNPEYRMELVRLYVEEQEEEELIEEEIVELRELLREEPDPLVQLSLINVLSAAGEEEMFQQELDILHDQLETKIAEDEADNEERFYYAVLLGEHLNETAAAKEMVEQVLEDENEESWIYQEAVNYLGYLRTNDEGEDILIE